MKYCFLLTFLIMSLAASAQCVEINSLDVTPSRCQNSGSVVIHASGGSKPYVFEIISVPAGFALPPAQTDSMFGALVPGNYSVRVIDHTTCKDTQTFTITGNYVIMNPSASTTPTTCPGGSDGSVSVSLPFGQGRAPFKYETISPSPVIKPLQSAAVLSGLSAGTYTYRIWDSCGNFQTRTTTVAEGIGTFTASLCAFWAGCDSTDIAISISASGGAHKFPYTVRWIRPGGDTIIHTITSGGAFANDALRIGGGVGATVQYQVVNNCGVSTGWSGHTTLDYVLQAPTASRASCTTNSYSISIGGNCVNRTPPVSAYILINPSGDTVAKQTTAVFTGFPAAANYKVAVVTSCTTLVRTFTWSNPAAPSYTVTKVKGSCKVGAAGMSFRTSGGLGNVTVVITGGPDSVKFGDGSTVFYTYPDTVTKTLPARNSSTQGYYFFGKGAYTVVLYDTCGYLQTRTVTILDEDLKGKVAFKASSPMSCPGSNKIVYEWASEKTGEQGRIHTVPLGSFSGIDPNRNFSGTGKDSVTGMSDGTYVLAYKHYELSSSYQWRPVFVSAAVTCDESRDTVTVPGVHYVNPQFNNPAIAVCTTGTNVALIPDYSKGVPPYRYEITSGPGGYTAPLQSSPAFGGLSAGTYNFRMSDACGNSYSRNLYIDTLGFSPVTSLGTGCLGSTTLFIAQTNPYYKHKWIKPDGSTYLGDTLTMDPVTATDFGTYSIELYSDISGCKDTVIRSGVFADCLVLPLDETYFSAKKNECRVTLSWKSPENTLTELQQSRDGAVYTTIYKGVSKGHDYTKVETDTKGKQLFRLLVHHSDKRVEYSTVLSVDNTCGAAQVLRVFPNPATDQIIIDGLEEESSVIIINNVGTKVWEGSLSASQRKIMTGTLVPGLYHVQISTPSVHHSLNFIKL